MKILMTADTVGGVWVYALELVRALAPHGVEVGLATMGAPLSDDQRAQAAALRNLAIFESDFKLEWMRDPWADVRRAGEWLLHLRDRFTPDVIHLNNYAHGALPWDVPTLVVAHSCVLSWWESVKRAAAPAEWDRYREAVRRGVRSASFVAAPSKAMLDALDRHYGPLPPGRVIYNGRRGDLFHPAAKQPLIFTAGRLWDEAKNVHALDVAARDLPWRVVAAGSTAHPDGADAPPLAIEYLGRRTPREVGAWLGQAAIYALPARYEPFGLSALEAALSGCALVLGDIPSLREIWGGAALFVPPDDPDALRAALRSLIERPALRHGLAERARHRARRLTPERMAAQYLMIYQRLLAAEPALEAAPRAQTAGLGD